MNPHPTLLLAALLAAGQAVSAAPAPLELPPPATFADTESSITHALGETTDLTRFFTLFFEASPDPASAVQAAFGTDRDADGDLAPEETELVVGCDCGVWFLRDERRQTARTWAPPAEAAPRLFTAYLRPRTDGIPEADGFFFRRTWNAIKVTTRGPRAAVAQLSAELKNNPLKVVIR